MTDATRSVLTDFGIVSIAIIIAHLIRNKVKWIQATYMPSSVIAGILVLFFGKEFVNILPFSMNGEKLAMATYPSWLVVFLFATLFMGHRKKEIKFSKTLEHTGDTFFFNLSSLLGQYGFALLFGILILTPLFPMLPEGFAIFLPAGFIGGYGTAAAMGSVFERGGPEWEGAMTLGNASATVGIMAAVFAGMVIINIATRKGWTRMISTMQKMPASMRSGFVPKSERKSLGSETVSPMALDSLTWHMCLVVAVALGAFSLRDFIQDLFQSLQNTLELPVFGLALVIGAIVQGVLNRFGIGQYIDRGTIHRIGSLVTDYLIVFGIGSITTHVVMNNAIPLLLLFIFGFSFTIALMWFVGRRICRDFWFERSITMYGWNTGSVATSVALLRVIDPDMKTPVLEDFGLAYIGISFIEIAIIALLPPLILNGMIGVPTFILIVGFFASLVLSRYLVGWFNYPADAIRPGEEEVINAQNAE